MAIEHKLYELSDYAQLCKSDEAVLVCGGRNFSDHTFLARILHELHPNAIVHGDAHGADSLSGKWARSRGIPEIKVPAPWDYHNRAAGPKRNGWMIKFIRVGLVVAFPGSRGTANMIRQAKEAGIPVYQL